MKVFPVMERRQVPYVSCHHRFKSMTGSRQEGRYPLGDGVSLSTPHDFPGPSVKSHEVWQSLVSLRPPCPYNSHHLAPFFELDFCSLVTNNQ